MAKLVIVKGESRGKEFLLTKSKFKIGRGQNNNLMLSESTVSRKHASIKYKGGKYFIINFGRNGTRINGELIKSGYLKDGDEIEIGSNAILYREEPAGIQDGMLLKESGRNHRKIHRRLIFISLIIISGIFLVIFRHPKMGIVSILPSARNDREAKKVDNSEDYFKLARRLYREREIREENLFISIQSWQKGLRLLDKSSVPETVAVELKMATEELDRKIKNEMFKAYQSYHLGNLSICKSHLKRVLKLIPDPADKRYQSALAKLRSLRQK